MDALVNAHDEQDATVRAVNSEPLRVGELGEIDRFRIMTAVRDAPTQPLGKAQRKTRAEHEMRVAVAVAQPQGLGLLFAGLRPRGQR